MKPEEPEKNTSVQQQVINDARAKEKTLASMDVRKDSPDGEPVNIYDMGLTGEYPTGETFFNLKAKRNVNFVSDKDSWNSFMKNHPEVENFSPEQIQRYKQAVEDGYRNFISGNVKPPVGLSGDAYSRRWGKKIPEDLFSKGVLMTQRGNPLVFQAGGEALPNMTPDQAASSTPYAVDKNGNLVDSKEFFQCKGRNRLAIDSAVDEATGAKTYFWKELKDNEWVDPSTVQSVFGERTVDDGTYMGAMGRGIGSSFVGSTVSGFGWLMGRIGDVVPGDENNWFNNLEKSTAMFQGAMKHQNYTEAKDPFSNWKAFMYGFGEGTGQLAQMMLTSYATGGVGALAGMSQKAISGMSQIAGLIISSAAKAEMVKQDLIARGVPEGDANRISFGISLTAAATESLIGPNILLDPIKNRYTRGKLMEFIEQKVITPKYLAASKLGKRQMLQNGLSKFVDRMDKYSLSKALVAAGEEVWEEITENALDNGVKSFTNYVAENYARRNLNMLKGCDAKLVSNPNGTPLYYDFVDPNGERRQMTVEEYKRLQQVVDDGGYYKPREITMQGSLTDAAMAAITAFPMGIGSFYMGDRSYGLDMNDIYDLSVKVRSGEVKMKDLDNMLNELSDRGRIPSMKLNQDGSIAEDEGQSALAIYKDALHNEINSVIAVMDKHGIMSPTTVRAMSDATNMNRFIVNGAIGAAHNIESINAAKEAMEKGEKITPNDFLKGTESVEELDKMMQSAQERFEYFTKKKETPVEIGDKVIKGEKSQAFTDYFNQQSMTYNALELKFRKELEANLAKAGKGVDIEQEMKRRVKKGSLESFIVGAMPVYSAMAKQLGYSGYDVLFTFKKDMEEIENLRSQMEQEKVEMENQKNQNYLSLSKNLSEAIDKIGAPITLSEEEIGSIKQKHQDIYSKEVKAINEEVDAAIAGLATDSPDYESALGSLNESRIGKISDAQSRNESNAALEIANEHKVKNLNAMRGSLAGISQLMTEAGSTGVQESVRKSVEGLMDRFSDFDEQFLFSNSEEDAEKISNIMDMAEGLRYNTRSFEMDENNQPKSYQISEQDAEAIFERAIMGRFINKSALALAQDIKAKVVNNEEVTLSDADKDMLKGVLSGITKLAYYLHLNVNHQQNSVENDSKLAEHSQLNNRTRISDGLYNQLLGQNSSIKDEVNALEPFLGSEKDANDRMNFETNLYHVNFSYLSVSVMMGSPDLRGILFSNDELYDATDQYTEDVEDALGRFIESHKNEVPQDMRGLIGLVPLYKNSKSEEFKADCKNLLAEIERLSLDYQSKFYKEMNGKLHSSQNGKGIMEQVLNELDRMSNNESVFDLDLTYGYLNSQELYYKTYADEVKIVDRNQIFKRKIENGKEVYEKANSYLFPIALVNNIFQWSTIDSKEAYTKLKENLQSDVDNGRTAIPVPTFEQIQSIFLVAAHLKDPGNEYFLDADNKLKKRSEKEEDYVKNAIFIRGYAGSGKTTVILRNAIRIADIKDKPNIVIVAPSKEVAKVSYDTLSEMNGLTEGEALMSFNEVHSSKDIPADASIVILDEATLLSQDEITSIKSKIKGEHPVVAVGDESQTRSDKEHISQPIHRSGKKTIPIIQQFRTKIRTIRNFQEVLRDFSFKGREKVLPSLEYVEYEGKTYGGKYLKTPKEVIDAFAMDNDPTSMLVVLDPSEAIALRKQYPGRKIYAANFDINDENATCVSGLSAKRVYVAIDTTSINEFMSNLPNKVMTAASRATEFLVLSSRIAESTEVNGTISGLTDYLKDQQDHKQEALDEIDRISSILGEQPKRATTTKAAQVAEEVEERRPGTALASSTMGFKHVMDRISAFVAKVSRKTKEDKDEDQVPEDQTKTSVTTLVNGQINERMDRDKSYGPGTVLTRMIRRIVSGKNDLGDELSEQIDRLGDEASISDQSAKFKALKNNPFIQGISEPSAQDGTIIPTPFIQGKIGKEGNEIAVTGSPIALRVLGEHDGKPILRIVHIAKPAYAANRNTYKEMEDFLTSITNGSLSPAEISSMYESKTLPSAGMKLIETLALYKEILGDSALVAGFEVLAVDNSLKTSVMVSAPFILDTSRMVLPMATALKAMGITPMVEVPIETFMEQGRVNDRLLTEREKKEVAGMFPSTLKEGSLISYSDNGVQKEASVNSMFVRFTDGKPSFMLTLSNGVELPIEQASVTEAYIGSTDRELSMYESNKVYAGGFVEPFGLTDSQSQMYRAVRDQIMRTIQGSTAFPLTRRYVPTFSSKLTEGKTIHHAIIYEVDDATIDSAIESLGYGNLSEKEKAHLRSISRVVAIERSAYWGKPFKAKKRLFQRSSIEGIVKDSEDLSSMSQERIEEVRSRIMEEIDRGDPDMKESARIVLDQFNFAVEHAKGDAQQVSVYSVDSAKPLFTERDESGISMVPLGEVMDAESSRFSYDPTLHTNYVLTDRVLPGGTRMSSKPIFTVYATDRITGKTVPLRVFTKRFSDITDQNEMSDLSAQWNSEVDDLFDAMLGDELDFSMIDGLSVKRFLDTNAKRIIDMLKTDQASSVNSKLGDFIEVHNGKYIRIRLEHSDKTTKERFRSTLHQVIAGVVSSKEAFGDMYLPFATQDGGGNTKVLTDMSSVQTIMHKGDNGYFGANGLVIQLPNQGKTVINAQEARVESTGFGDYDIYSEDSTFFKKGEVTEPIDVKEAKRILTMILGDEFVKKNGDLLRKSLTDPKTGVMLLGMVNNARITLREIAEGKVDKPTVRHEAMHIITACILNDASRVKLQKEVEALHPGKNYLEVLSEMFESPVTVRNTFINRVIAAIKHLLYRMGLYHYNVDSLLYAAEYGYFSNADVKPDEGVYGKRYSRYNDLTGLLDAFGSVPLIDSLIEEKIKLSFRAKMITNRVYNRKGETLGAAINGVVNEWNQNARYGIAKKAMESNPNVKVHPNDLLTRDELGNVKVTWSGKNGEVTKTIFGMTAEDYADVVYNEKNRAVANDIVGKYRMHRLSDRNLVKGLIQRLFPDVNIDELVDMENTSKRVSSGVSNSGVINGDMANDQRDLRTTLAPFLKFFISTIPYYQDITLKHNTLTVKHASQKGFVRFNTIHRICVDAGMDMQEVSDTPNIKRFIENIKEIASSSRGEKRRAALSLLLEIGDLDVVDITKGAKNEGDLIAKLRNVIPTGYYGFSTRKNLFGDKAADVAEKGRILTETLLVPMVNVYRSSVERSILHVDETKEFKRIVENGASNVSQVKGKIRSGVQLRLYDENGYVTSDSLERFRTVVNHNEEGSIGVMENGAFVPVLTVNPESKTITVSTDPETNARLYQILRAMGIDIREESFTSLMDKKNSVEVGRSIWAMAAGVFVNASTSGIMNDVNLKIQDLEDLQGITNNDKRIQAEKEIRDILLANQEEYTQSPYSHYKNRSGAIPLMKAMLREEYAHQGLHFESAERSMSFGENVSSIEEFIEKNDTMRGLYTSSYNSPNVMDSFKFINELSRVEMEVIDTDYVVSTRDIMENNVQTVVLGSEITELLANNGKRLLSILGHIGSRFKKSLLFDGVKAASLFTSIKDAIFKNFVPVLSIDSTSDFDGWLGKTAAMDYNKAPKARVFHAMINLGFINELMKEKRNGFYMVLDPHADKKNTRVLHVTQGAGAQQLFSVVKKEEVIDGNKIDITSVEITRKALINAIGSNVTYALNAQKDSLSKWVEVLNKFKQGCIKEGATMEQVQKVIATLDAKELKEFVEHSKLVQHYDYKITKEGVNLGNAASLSSAHSIYDAQFCQAFSKAASDRNVSPDALYSLIKKQFFPAYRDFTEMLQDSGYKVPNAYFNALSSAARKKKIADLAKAKSQLSEEIKEAISKKISSIEEKENQLKADSPAYTPIAYYLKENLQSFTKLTEIPGLVGDNGVLNELGFRVKEETSRILKELKIGAKYDKIFSELQKDYSDFETSNYYDPSDLESWNPVFEAFFFGYHLVNNDVAKITKGSTFYTKNLVDFVKRSAGESAPGTKVDATIPTGMPKQFRSLVVDFGGDTHPWAVEEDGKKKVLKQHKSLKSDGQGILNPIMGVLLQNSAGPEYGPVGNSMIKNVLHYHDFSQNNTMYMKQALRRISGTTIQMSEEDLNLLKVMNRPLWKMSFRNGLTYGDAFTLFANGDRTYSFDEIVNHAVDAINATPSLKDQIIFQAIDPSALKTGLHSIHTLDEVLKNEEGYTDEDLMVADTERLRIQLNVEKDIYHSRKNLPIQILNLIGILPGNSDTYTQVHGTIARIVDHFTDGFVYGKGSTGVNPVTFMRNLLKRSIGGDDQQRIANVSRGNISLSVARKKSVSSLISYVNDFVKPTMSGNTYAQGTCRVDVYRDKSGNVYTGVDAKLRIAVDKEMEKSVLKPMRYTFDGKDLEHTSEKSVEDQVREILSDPERKGKLKVEPAEVVMPYPYIRQFGLKETMSLDEARRFIKENSPARLEEFERSLDIFFLRIPTSNASAGSIARIVGFMQDAGNTILIPHQKNAIDGSDQDIDMLHVFFRSLTPKEQDTDSDSSIPDFMDRGTHTKLQNTIFESVHSYYSNVNNYEMTFRANDMQSLRDEADLADQEDALMDENQEIRKKGRAYANMPASSQRQHEINQDGKAVGFFANMGAFFGKIISISNMGNRNLFNPNFSLLAGTSATMSRTIDFISKLINAATDNAKENILGRINLNSRTASSVAGMLMLGYTEEQVVRVLRSQEMRRASDGVRATDDLDRYSKKMHEILQGMDSLSEIEDGKVISAFNEEFKQNASSIYDVMRLSVEDAIANRQEKTMGKYFVHALHRMAMIGDAITRFGMMTDITKELPSSPEELRAKLYSIETVLGMKVSDFLNGENRTAQQQIDFNVDRLKSDRGYIGSMTENSYRSSEAFMRNPENTMDLHAVARLYPNFMSTLRLLNGLVEDVLPEVFYIDRSYKEGVLDSIRKKTGVGLVTSADKIKAIDSALNSYAIGKFFSSMDDRSAFVRMNGVAFDMREPEDRVRFAYAYADTVRRMKESIDPEIRNSSFAVTASVDKSYDDAFPIVKMNLPYNTDASVGIDIQRSMEGIAEKLGASYDFVRASEIYSMLMYGHGGQRGAMSNIVGSQLTEEFTDWVDGSRTDIYENFDDVLQSIVFMVPQMITMNHTKSSTGYTHKKITRNGRSKSKSKRYENVLFDGNTLVDSRFATSVNVYGSGIQMLVPMANAVNLPLLDMIRLINSGTNSVMIKNGWSKVIPDRVSDQSVSKEGFFPVSFSAYIPTGETVNVSVMADKDGKYKDYVVTMTDEQAKALKDAVSEKEAKEDQYNCKL